MKLAELCDIRLKTENVERQKMTVRYKYKCGVSVAPFTTKATNDD